MRIEQYLLCVLLVMAGGCSVHIKGTTPVFVDPGPQLSASATTTRNGTAPTGITLHYTHLRDGQSVASVSQAAHVTSTQDDHKAALTPQGAPEFAAFDQVNLIWRVTYNTWVAQAASSSDSQTVVIRPGLNLTVSPDPLRAGEQGTGIVSIRNPRSAAVIVKLQVINQPVAATVSLNPDIVVIPAGSTASQTFQIITTPRDQSGDGTSVCVGPCSAQNSCTIEAKITQPAGPIIMKTNAEFRVGVP